MAVQHIDYKDNQGNVLLKFSMDLDPSHANHHTILEHLKAGVFYEPDVSGAMQRILAKGDTFVDVGANVGFHTLVGASLVGPEGRVISFEPGANALAELRHNLELSKFAHVTVIPNAVTDRAGEVEFFLNADDSGGNALWNPAHHPANRTPAQATRVQTVSLNEALVPLLEGKFPRLMKIDTEGAELMVLRGATELLSPQRLPYVICELFDFGLRELGGNAQEMRDFMRERGYETFVLSRRNTLPVFVPPSTRITSKYIVNLLFSTVEAIEMYWPIADWPSIDY